MKIVDYLYFKKKIEIEITLASELNFADYICNLA